MQTIAFQFVDVFAPRPLTGNPVVVVPDADQLSVQTMQALAAEFHQTETVFVLRPTDAVAAVRTRSFTVAGAEVGGVGHHVLGTWLWLAGAGRVPTDDTEQWHEIGTEHYAVRLDRDTDDQITVTMTQAPPSYGATVSTTSALVDALGLVGSDLLAEPAPQVVSTGAGHLLVGVTDRAAVDRVRPDTAALRAVLHDVGGEGCCVYSRDPVDPTDGVAYARFFNPTMGIAEDPATGTAAGPLAALLVRAGFVGTGRLVIEQGYALGRPSRIGVHVSDDRVQLVGTGVVVGSGTMRI